MLRDLGDLRTEYTSDVDNIAHEFYDPCLRESNSYDRISGFFSSTAYHLTHEALGMFITANNGKMRLLCSPRVSRVDADSIVYGYEARDNSQLVAELREELHRLLASPSALGAKLLAALIASGHLDLKLARVASSASESQKSMFHDKVGMFRDSDGDMVGFRGSANESYLGLSSRGNVESIDVWPSWDDGRDAERVQKAVDRFERLWNGDVPGVVVSALPNEIRAELEHIAEDSNLDALLRDAAAESTHHEPAKPSIGGKDLHDHQIAAFERWVSHDHRGLLEHATGSGKTFTGLYAASVAIAEGLVPLILVPSKLLLEQWAVQVRELLGARVLLAGGGHARWRQGGLRAAIEAGRADRPYVVIAVLNSVTSPAFQAQVRPIVDQIFVIADEAHRLGSTENLGTLEWLQTPWRLGLSATPARAGDPDGTRAIFDYFGGVIHRYSLKDALDDGVLSKYTYHPSWVGLTDEEQERWDALTAEIRQRYARAKAPGAKQHTKDQLKFKLIERSRIAKSAARKIPMAVDLIEEHFQSDGVQRWLVYCDNIEQVAQVRQALDERGISSWEYHRQMSGDPDATLQLLDVAGGIVVAIKCLDEGVDIPAATHALVLASSRNPREFIQRRGRVLRRAPGKTVATLIDVLVLPDEIDKGDPSWSLVVGELARAMQFADWEIGFDAVSRLENKWISMGLSLAQLDEVRPAGVEADENDD
jgi:superfamily II DNA or RNA helicase